MRYWTSGIEALFSDDELAVMDHSESIGLIALTKPTNPAWSASVLASDMKFSLELLKQMQKKIYEEGM